MQGIHLPCSDVLEGYDETETLPYSIPQICSIGADVRQTYPDGTIYIGEFLNNRNHGFGTITYTNGKTYEGSWVKGVFEGSGIAKYSNGYVYEGEFLDGKYHGKGTLVYQKGYQYTGDWESGVRHGDGVATFPDGTIYTGGFVSDQREGTGTITMPDGFEYAGGWKAGEIDGEGVALYPNGDTYEGFFSKGIAHRWQYYEATMRLINYIGYQFFPRARDETNCNYVSSRGLLKSCKFHNSRPRSSSDELISVSEIDLSSGDSIYVTTDALDRFKAELLPRISTPFVLLTGDSDIGVNSSELGVGTIDEILNSPYLIRWFAQNLTANHTKQINMPLGLDYHTKARKFRHDWGEFQTPVMQELDLISVARTAPKMADKAILGYCNWYFTANRGARQDCLSGIEHSAMYFEPTPVLQKESWNTNSKMLFTVSPTGFGADCHRTWEAIALGTIPIVDKSELSPLFRNLPVIEVDDWSIVTTVFLEESAEKLLGEKFDFGPMFLGYWKMLFQGESPKPLKLSFSDFVNFGIERAKEIY